MLENIVRIRHSHELRGAAHFGLVTDPDISFACGSMVRFNFFTEIWLGEPNFREKAWNLPPCRRRVGPCIQVNTWFETDRVTPVIHTSYAVRVQTSRLHPITAYFACGSMVRFILFHKRIHVVNSFVKKIWFFSPV
jgi:hypothetical protein